MPIENNLALMGSISSRRVCMDLVTHSIRPDRMSLQRLLGDILEAKRRGNESVTVWGTGKPTREFYYVEDAARVIVNAAESYNNAARYLVG